MELTPRQGRVLEMVAESGDERVEVSRLARALNVSAVTMRREVEVLAGMGRVRRLHGAVVMVRPQVAAFRFEGRGVEGLPAKRAIARLAAGLVQPGMMIGLDTGTTTLEIARTLVERLDAASQGKSGRRKLVRVITNSLPAAALLQPSERVEVILAGGVLRRSDPDVTGPLAADVLGRFRTDLAFIGADAFSPDGVYVEDISTVNTALALLQGTHAGVLVAESRKFGGAGRVRYAKLTDFKTVITDDATPIGRRLGGAGVDVLVAEVPEERAESGVRRG